MNESFNAVRLLLVNSTYWYDGRWVLATFKAISWYDYDVSVLTHEPALYQTPECRVIYAHNDSLRT
jgi:hypothetical protein